MVTIVTVLYFLDDVTLENGPLEVVPKSHKGDIYSLWQDGVFTGAVNQAIENKYRNLSVKCTGKAGDACLMHSRLLHGSLPNATDKNRNLFIITYVAEDAMPLDKNPLPNKFEGEIVRGKRTGFVRSSSFTLELPDNSNGYQIVYQRCCRNAQVININNPGDFGSSLVGIPCEANSTGPVWGF